MAPQQPFHIVFDELRKDDPDWKTVHSTLLKDPRVASLLKFKDHDENSLHVSCSKKAPISVVQLLIDQYPKALQGKDSGDNRPLHSACACEQQSLEVIQWLVLKFPDALKEKTPNGSLPLHVACYANQSFEVIQWLVQQFPGALQEKNSHGYLPLHMACFKTLSFEVIQCLVQQLRTIMAISRCTLAA